FGFRAIEQLLVGLAAGWLAGHHPRHRFRSRRRPAYRNCRSIYRWLAASSAWHPSWGGACALRQRTGLLLSVKNALRTATERRPVDQPCAPIKERHRCEFGSQLKVARIISSRQRYAWHEIVNDVNSGC